MPKKLNNDLARANTISRRSFIGRSAAMAGIFTAPMIIPASARGADGTVAPGNRITIGQIGRGIMGRGHLSRLTHESEVEVIALCDVDKVRLDEGMAELASAYADRTQNGTYKGCTAYNDYRELLARDDIDAVVIVTPDHWHSPMSIHAAEAGKDVYCEKPISITIDEGRQLVEAVRRNFSVRTDGDGRVLRVIEKPRFVESMLKGCGLYLFSLHIFDAIRRTPRTSLRDEYELTDSIQILVDLDLEVRAVPVVAWDMNLTYIGDLVACSRRRLAALGVPSLTGGGCRIAPGTELVETVLGDGVEIRRPARLERCVVMPGAVLDDGADLSDMVITRTARLQA